jgi:hypothetical protein
MELEKVLDENARDGRQVGPGGGEGVPVTFDRPVG